MNITVITPPPFEPVTVAEAYDHLRWDAEEEGSPPTPFYPLQGMIERNIASARAYVEQKTRRALVEQTVRMSVGRFPGQANGWRWWFWSATGACGIELLRPPVIEVVSMEYFDGNNALQTVAPENYYLTDDLLPKLMLSRSFDTPFVCDRDDAIRITYRVGYTPSGSPPTNQEEYASNVPQGLKDAILLQVQLLSDRFDKGEKEDLERTRDALLYSYTIQRF